jgi:uncharacterized protein (DUF58 family)
MEGEIQAPLLPPQLIARIAALEIEARVAAEGALTGLHRSPRRGSSVEFAEHKEYAPGDELRHLDWKTYGRSDRLYVKRFEEETELHALFVVDASESMHYGEGGTDKLRYARVLSAALAYLLLTRRDRAGLVATSGELVPIGSRPSHLSRLLASLVSLEPAGSAKLATALRRADALTKRRTQIIVLSDLLDPEVDEILAAARSLKARGHDPVFLQLLHPDERTLPFAETGWYESKDAGVRVFAEPAAVRRAYLEEVTALIARWQAATSAARIPFASVDTSTPAADALASILRGPLAPVGRSR